jgi:hypothetical protein
LFFTLLTAGDTGQIFNHASGHGRSRAFVAPSRSPNHSGQSASPKMTGLRSCSAAIAALGRPLMIAQAWIELPRG